MNLIDDILQAHGFSEPYHVEGRSSIADIFSKNERCGIYVLHFVSGDKGKYYVGQATNVVRRFADHLRNPDRSDIEKISFKTLPRKNGCISSYCGHRIS